LSKEKETGKGTPQPVARPPKPVAPAIEVEKRRGFRGLVFRFQTLRTIIQLLFFFLFFALIFGLGPWPILLPVTGLLGVPLKTMGDALGALQYDLYLLVAPWLALASIFAASAIVGRAFCAWSCPFGFVQDILQTMKSRHSRVSLRTHNQMIRVKYFVLAATLLTSSVLALAVISGAGKSYQQAFGVFAIAPFNALSPADTLFAVIPKTVIDIRQGIFTMLQSPSVDVGGTIIGSIASVQPLFWARMIILVLVLALAVYVPRGWCRYVCPQGAFSALLMRFSFLGLKRDPVRCNRAACRDCVEVCPMMVPILEQPWEKFNHPECIMCLKCVDACTSTAIKPKFP
jgi:polyferredoxin